MKLYERDAAVEREELCWFGSKNRYSSQVLFTALHFFRPFVSVPHPRLTVLAGDAYSAVTQQGKVYIDRARGIQSLADQILAIGCIVFGTLVNSYIPQEINGQQ